MDVIEDAEQLRAAYGAPGERSVKKQLSRLDKHCRDFIARSPFVVIASADPEGHCDASPKGDAPGFVHVIDEINSRMWDALRLGHLAIKERVDNLIRWGFFAEQTIKRHKAVALTPVAGSAVSRSLSDAKPLLEDLCQAGIAGGRGNPGAFRLA